MVNALIHCHLSAGTLHLLMTTICAPHNNNNNFLLQCWEVEAVWQGIKARSAFACGKCLSNTLLLETWHYVAMTHV